MTLNKQLKRGPKPLSEKKMATVTSARSDIPPKGRKPKAQRVVVCLGLMEGEWSLRVTGTE